MHLDFYRVTLDHKQFQRICLFLQVRRSLLELAFARAFGREASASDVETAVPSRSPDSAI